jgi:hypothetical protein
VAANAGEKLTVKVVNPRRGAMQHLTSRVGSAQAYESVKSGYLQMQNVDYGTPVKRAAAVDLAQSQVAQMKAYRVCIPGWCATHKMR